jgi:hypothetical protein
MCLLYVAWEMQLVDGKGLEEGAENDDVLVCVNEAICRAAISRRRSSTGR